MGAGVATGATCASEATGAATAEVSSAIIVKRRVISPNPLFSRNDVRLPDVVRDPSCPLGAISNMNGREQCRRVATPGGAITFS
jgi:hypothetical protein